MIGLATLDLTDIVKNYHRPLLLSKSTGELRLVTKMLPFKEIQDNINQVRKKEMKSQLNNYLIKKKTNKIQSHKQVSKPQGEISYENLDLLLFKSKS